MAGPPGRISPAVTQVVTRVARFGTTQKSTAMPCWGALINYDGVLPSPQRLLADRGPASDACRSMPGGGVEYEA
jgi:hypothetical protein